MILVGKDLCGSSLLYHLSQIHHRDIIGDMLDHGQVVGDKQICEIPLLLELHHQVQNLCLNGHVQSRDRLIADHKLRIDRKRSCNHDSLAATAVKLVRVEIVRTPRQTDHLHQFLNALSPLLRILADLVQPKRLLNDLCNGETRVQGCVGILKNDLHLPTNGDHLFLAERA